MYFLEFDSDPWRFRKIKIFPLQIKNFRLVRAHKKDVNWIRQILSQISLKTEFIIQSEHQFDAYNML
jgi:poly-gamma-glutamate capsule biosynthesis protein CapA/YwtB (metallophosphatase superfamily)